MLDLEPRHLEMVTSILQRFVEDYEVWAFGSRVKGSAQKFSDLDLAVITKERLPFTILGQLKEAFSESDLPIKVDVIDFSAVNDDFRTMIDSNHYVIKHGSSASNL